jgi:membrane-bound lytic murein transglycosylase F
LQNKLLKILLIYALTFGLLYLFILSPTSQLSNWQRIQEKGYLNWVTRPSPLTYYTSLDGIVGLEYEIIKGFCEENNLELKITIATSNAELFKLLDNNKTDVAGANLTLTQERKEKYLSTVAYNQTYISLISSLAKPKIKKLDELNALKGAIINHSSYVKIANELTHDYKADIDSLSGKSIYELLQMVTNREVDFTLADSNIASIYKAYIPQLRIGMKLSDMHDIGFLLAKQQDNTFKEKIDIYLNKFKQQGKIQKYKDYIIDSLPNSKPADTVQFLKNYSKRWPQVKAMIYEASQKYDISPILLGAISYQESHWNANAVSPTLVKGLMMLTKDVAKEQNVSDRLDPLQSIEGGTRHLLKMLKKVPERITGSDRLNFAMAAYNLGYGNLERARIMTQKAGKSPDLWEEVKLFLPQLNELKEKKADGKTAVRYVENIHVYQNLLQWKEQQ